MRSVRSMRSMRGGLLTVTNNFCNVKWVKGHQKNSNPMQAHHIIFAWSSPASHCDSSKSLVSSLRSNIKMLLREAVFLLRKVCPGERSQCPGLAPFRLNDLIQVTVTKNKFAQHSPDSSSDPTVENKLATQVLFLLFLYTDFVRTYLRRPPALCPGRTLRVLLR
jgi:hypothetical protein